MEFLTRLKTEKYERKIQKYVSMLLNDKIRLLDVPEALRMNIRSARRIHIAAFRSDRGRSLLRYEQDLALLHCELRQAQRCGNDALVHELNALQKVFQVHCGSV